ncbi:MAG: PD-(D/E)XK nuclease family protein, partial [Candidatus Kapaibacteriota bacterium]
MKKTEGADPKIIISPTDLANHHACSHVTKLELERLSGRITSPPVFEDAFLRMLQDRGRAFEGRVLEQYVREGKDVVSLEQSNIEGIPIQSTIEDALVLKPDVIYQAKLSMPIQNIDTLEFSGKADFIIKNDEGQYEVSDTKLTQSTKVGSILQVSLYSEMLTQYTGQQPEKLYIHKFGGEVEEYRIDQTMAYYETIKDDIFETIHTYHELAQGQAVNIPIIQDIPEPVAHCSVCAYRMKCDDERRAAKHLSLVAGISKNYRERFIAEGHEDTDALHVLPDDYAPTGQTSEHILKGFRKLIKQNKKQYETEANEAGGSDAIAHEYLPLEPLMGLNALPEPHEDDLFLDFEYDNYVDEMEGLVYLTGWRDMQDNYTGLWAVNAVQEEEQYRTLITKLKEITNWDPTVAYIDTSSMTVEENKHEYYVECPITYTGAHIYVYTSAEKTRLQALSEKYGDKDFVDFLIKCQVLVNLHKVIKETMILGLPSYGLKDIERFMKNRTGFTRNMELDTARKHRNLLEVTLNSSILAHRDEEIEELKVQNAQGIEEFTKEIVERYNDDDCRSLIVLRDILEEDRIQQNVT